MTREFESSNSVTDGTIKEYKWIYYRFVICKFYQGCFVDDARGKGFARFIVSIFGSHNFRPVNPVCARLLQKVVMKVNKFSRPKDHKKKNIDELLSRWLIENAAHCNVRALTNMVL